MKKFLPLLICSIVTIFSFLFLPFGENGWGESYSLLEWIDTPFGEAFAVLAIIYIIISIGTLIGALTKVKVLALVFSIIQTVFMLILVASFSSANALEYMGIGFWIAVFGSVGNIVCSAIARRD